MYRHPKSDFQLQLEQNAEWQKAQRGELYHAFIPELVAARDRCISACNQFNATNDRSRRNLVKLWREIICSPIPLPSSLSSSSVISSDPETHLFQTDPWICAPIHADYGFNIHLGVGTFINFNSTFVDTCPITIGARTIVGPNCSFFSGTHPVDPAVRRGLEGPETGAPIEVGDDCWFGGNVIVLPGVKIGKGCTVGAGSVVTKDVPSFHVVAGNPARILRKIETTMADEPDDDPVGPSPNPDSKPGPDVATRMDQHQNVNER